MAACISDFVPNKLYATSYINVSALSLQVFMQVQAPIFNLFSHLAQKCLAAAEVVYVPLANVLRLMVYSPLCGNHQVRTHIQQQNHRRTFPESKRPSEYLALLGFQ